MGKKKKQTLEKVIASPLKIIADNSRVFPAQRETRDLTGFVIMREARPLISAMVNTSGRGGGGATAGS